jgi:hypothetical protein
MSRTTLAVSTCLASRPVSSWQLSPSSRLTLRSSANCFTEAGKSSSFCRAVRSLSHITGLLLTWPRGSKLTMSNRSIRAGEKTFSAP